MKFIKLNNSYYNFDYVTHFYTEPSTDNSWFVTVVFHPELTVGYLNNLVCEKYPTQVLADTRIAHLVTILEQK